MKHRLLSLSYDDLTVQEWEDRLREALGSPCAFVLYTPNAEIAHRCEVDPGFSALLSRADLLAPDGEGVILGGKLAGRPFRHPKRAGVELGETTARLCAQTEAPLFLFGGREGVAKQAGERLCARYPGLRIAGTACGYGFDSEQVAAQVRESGAGAVFVCLGSPAQEKWIDDHRDRLGSVLLCGLGGSLDVYAGVVRRAPRLLIALRLEWLWRLAREPRRWRRMLAIPRYLRMCARAGKHTHTFFL